MTLTTASSAADLLPAPASTTTASVLGVAGTTGAKPGSVAPDTFAELIADAEALTTNNAQPTSLSSHPDKTQAGPSLNRPSPANGIDTVVDVPDASQTEIFAPAPEDPTAQLPDASASAAEITSMLAASARPYPSATAPVPAHVQLTFDPEDTTTYNEAMEVEPSTTSQQTPIVPAGADADNTPAAMMPPLSSAADSAASTHPVLQTVQSAAVLEDALPLDAVQQNAPEVVTAESSSSKPCSNASEATKATHTHLTSSKNEARDTDPVPVLPLTADAPLVPQLSAVPSQTVLIQTPPSQASASDGLQQSSTIAATSGVVQQQNTILPQQIAKSFNRNDPNASDENELAHLDTDATSDADAPRQTDAPAIEPLPVNATTIAPTTNRPQQPSTDASNASSSQAPIQAASVPASQTPAKQAKVGSTSSVSKPSASPSTNKARSAATVSSADGNSNSFVNATRPTATPAAPALTAAVPVPTAGTVRDSASVQTSTLSAVATALASMDQSAMRVAEPHNAPVGISVGLDDAQLGPVQIHAALASTGEVHIGISSAREQAQAVLEQITPLMHAAVTQQADAQGSAMSFRIAATSAGSSLTGDTPGQNAHNQSSSWQGTGASSTGGGLAQQTPQRESRQGSSHPGTYRNSPFSEPRQNYASLPRSPATPLFSTVPASPSYGHLSVRI